MEIVDIEGLTSGSTNKQNVKLPFKTSAAVTAKNVVSIGTDGKVAKSATDGTAALVIGVANDNIASGDIGEISVAGYVTGLVADGTIGAGAILKRSTNTAGAVMATATPATGEAIGVAVAASASGTVDAFLKVAYLS